MRELVRPLAELNSEEGDVWRWQEETWCGPLCDRRQPALERGMSFLFCERRDGVVCTEVSYRGWLKSRRSWDGCCLTGDIRVS